jgi:hypothetical protein
MLTEIRDGYLDVLFGTFEKKYGIEFVFFVHDWNPCFLENYAGGPEAGRSVKYPAISKSGRCQAC